MGSNAISCTLFSAQCSSIRIKSRSSFSSKPPLFHELAAPYKPLSFKSRKSTQRSSSVSFVSSKSRKLCCSQVKVEDTIDDETCELVNGAEILIGEGLDTFQAYLLKAVKNNNGAGILLLSDIYGFEDPLNRDFAYRIACYGYNVLVPDLFYGDPWSKDRPKASLDEWFARLDRERLRRNVFTAAKWMMDEFEAVGISKKLGVIGFCFGGGQVIDILAQDQGVCFGTGVSFYGTRINSLLASDIKVPLLLIAGDNDPICPVDVLNDVEKRVKESKLIVFNGRGHSFVHRPQSAEEDEDAEKAFILMRTWLHDKLLAGN